jgi:protein-L-isoaspartate O-methyltransferase
LEFVPGKRVLDAGCGEGYGADLLVQKARQRYQKPNLIFQKKDVAEC